MRGWMIFALILLVSVAVSAENLCSDTDGGGSKASDNSALTTKGEVKYGLTTMVDTCLTAEEGVSAGSGVWLKEYYCSSDQRRSEAYDCVKLGYSKCESGACVGGSSGSSSNGSNATSQPAQPVEHCGNKILEKSLGEECDPPNSICFGKTTAEYGSCQSDCKCKIAAAALENLEEQPVVCGDGYKHSVEACEEDAHCPVNNVCSSCKCVKQLTAEEIEAMKGSAQKEEKEEEEEEVSGGLEGVDLEPKNFSDTPGLKATSGISGFFKKLFGWVAKIFS